MNQENGFTWRHAVKRLVIFVAVLAAIFWSIFSVYRLIGLGLALLFFSVVPYYFHRALVSRMVAGDGFRLSQFGSSGSAFVSYRWNWPWWAEHYSYAGTVVSESREFFDSSFVVEGAFFAMIQPKVDCYVALRRQESYTKKDAISRHDDAKRLKELQRSPSIKHLDFQLTAITDDDLQTFKLWAHLESLVLDDTAITDQGIDFLKQLTQLKELRLERTSTTPAGRKQLRIALPTCDIFPEI